jgi:hypothetical protein
VNAGLETRSALNIHKEIVMSLIQEFHADHQKVVNALFDMRQAIAAREVGRVRSILAVAEKLVGPHFKFEELYLYPALEPFLSEGRIKRLLNEHDGIFRGVRHIAKLAQKDTWLDADAHSAMENLEVIYDHPVTCDGLSLWIEKLPSERQEELYYQMQECRRQGTTFSEYYRERQSA